MALIEFFSRFLHQYVVVCVALAIIPLKFLMVRLAKDPAAEVETLFAIPEDLCYVTLGLLLSSMTTNFGPLHAYFASAKYPRTGAAILLFLNFCLAFVVHKIARVLTKPQYETYRAALELRINNASQDQGLNLYAGEDHLMQIFLHHFTKLLLSVLAQLVLAGIWVYWMAKIFASR